MNRYFISLICLLSTANSVFADYQNPTTSSDCNLFNTPIYHTKRSVFEQAQACIQEILDEGDVSPFYDNVQTSCQGYEPRQCAHFYQKHCDLQDRIKVIETACSAKLSKHRLRERETKRAQEEFEREQRQRAEAQRQQAQAAHRQQMSQRNRILQDATRATMTGKGLGQAGKYATQLQRSPKQTGLTKYRMAYQAAHGRLPTLNAHSLSGLLTKYGTRFVLGANAAAQQDLRDALSQFDNSFGGQNSQSQGSIYNATNPRPFATQIDEAFALNDKVQAHIDRVTDAVQRLPVGDQSMVNTPAGNLLSEIVKARANGDISSFSNALIDYVSFAIKEAPQEYKEARASQSVDVDLRKERLAVLAMVEAEVKRLAAIVANERKKRKAANARRQKAANARRQSEARMRQQQWEYDQHMREIEQQRIQNTADILGGIVQGIAQGIAARNGNSNSDDGGDYEGDCARGYEYCELAE